MSQHTLRVLHDVDKERGRQERLWGVQKHSDEKWLAILAEEFGEVAKDIVERRKVGKLREELVQLAAVAVAHVEHLDMQT